MSEGTAQGKLSPFQKLKSDLHLLSDSARHLRDDMWEVNTNLFGVKESEVKPASEIDCDSDTGVIGGCSALVREISAVIQETQNTLSILK